MAGGIIVALFLVLLIAVIVLAFQRDKLARSNDKLTEQYYDLHADYNRLSQSYGVALRDIAKLKDKASLYGPPNKTKKRAKGRKPKRYGKAATQIRREKQVVQEQIHNGMMSIWPEG